MTNTQASTRPEREAIAERLWLAVPSADDAEAKARTQEMLDAYRAANLREAIEAARGEYLPDGTGSADDAAYNQAVGTVVAAIGALLEGK
ncbi:hypothetical protein AB0I27_22400 [Streptomyces sp. NPDC050597]|uniref:hypothetical protein n=1 Tax=Streptomyces sp. NPDC050597 TaxID=3157212 RepID=UPI003443A515